MTGAVILGNLTDCYLDIHDAGGGGDPISKVTTCTMTGLVAGSFVIRAEKFDKALEVQTSATAWAEAEVDTKKEMFRCGEKTGGVATYIRFVHDSTDNPPVGSVHWHCEQSARRTDAGPSVRPTVLGQGFSVAGRLDAVWCAYG